MTYRFPTLFFGLLIAAAPLSAQPESTQLPEEVVNTEAKFIEAAAQVYQNNQDKALEIYEELLAENPRLSAAAFAAARLYREQNPERALELLEQAYRYDPANKHIARELAVRLYEAGRYQQTADVYAVLLQKLPNREEYLLGQTEALFRGGHFREALQAIDAYTAGGHPLSTRLGREKLRLAVAADDAAVALATLRELRAAHPSNPDFYHELALFYQRTGEQDAARKTWQEMAERFPADERPRLALLDDNAAATADDAPAAAALRAVFADRSVALDAKVLRLLPLVQEVADREDVRGANALLPLGRLLTEVHPDSPKSYALYGDLLFYADRPAEAAAAYRQTLERDRSVFSVWEQLLAADVASRDYPALLEDSEQALLLFPNQAALYYYNGLALTRTGELTAAENTLLQGEVMVLDNSYLRADLLAAAARAQLWQGDFKEAQNSANQALELRPDHAPTRALLAEIQLRSGQLAAGQQELKKVLGRAANDPYVQAVEVLSLVLSDKIPQAKSLLEQYGPSGLAATAEGQELTGDVAFLSGNKEAALQAWRSARQLGGGSELLARKITRQAYFKQ